MRKFLILLKKEIRELLTIQIIAPLLVTAVVFFFLGHVLSTEQKKTEKPTAINLLNQDQTVASDSFIEILRQSKVDVKILTNQNTDQAIATTRNDHRTALIVISESFEKSLVSDTTNNIELYSILNNFSAIGSKDYTNLIVILSSVNQVFSDNLIKQNISNSSPEIIKNPIKTKEFVVIGDKKANVSVNVVMNFVSQQTMFIPLILFFVIIFAAQMIATAIANEKENKTLETLLTTPVSRKSIILSKMVAAGAIALLASVIYIISFRSYINGFMGGMNSSDVMSAQIVRDLGLALTPANYALLGISLFAGILVALSIALLLGSFAQDVKSVPGLISPLTIMVSIPYLLTLFLDINTASPALRYFAYAIPFSHIFMTAPNLFLHNYTAVIYGILYQLLWFLVFVTIAVKIFSTEKILVMKFNFFRKSK